MPKLPVEFEKTRDFSELINDTFTFIRQNFKQLITCFFAFCGIFILGSSVVGALQQIKVADMINGASGYGTETSFPTSRFAFLGIEYVISILAILVTNILTQLTVYSYIRLYNEKGRVAPTVAEVWTYVKYFFLRALGSTVVVFLLFIVGFAACIIPGAWLLPILSLILPIIIFENCSFGYAFSHSFRLIKEYWWITFGTLIIISLIVYFGAAILVLPITLINIMGLALHYSSYSGTLGVVTAVLQSLGHIFYIVPSVTIALCYFSLTEAKEGTGMLNRIQKFGSADLDTPDTTEQY